MAAQQHMITGILVEYYLLTILALILVILRSWMRVTITRNWRWDDYTIIIAWIISLAGLVMIQLGFNLGSSPVSTVDPKPGDLARMRFNTFFQMSNLTCTLVTKYSICFFILRIRDSRRLRWVLGLLMVPITLITLALIVILSMSCAPLWSDEIPAVCVPMSDMYTGAYVQSALTIVVDLCLTSAPVLILWDVRVRRGKKMFICGLMSLGLVATISNAIRCIGQYYRAKSHNMTWLTVVCILEQSAGIIAACIPACVPIFRRQSGKDGSSQGMLVKKQHVDELETYPSRQQESSDRLSSVGIAAWEECSATLESGIRSGGRASTHR